MQRCDNARQNVMTVAQLNVEFLFRRVQIYTSSLLNLIYVCFVLTVSELMRKQRDKPSKFERNLLQLMDNMIRRSVTENWRLEIDDT